jgi:hypothetical protein
MANADSAGLSSPEFSPALLDWIDSTGIIPDSAEPEPVESAQDADHIFPGKSPSELLYNKGCRCDPCTACHTDETRRRYQEHKAGTFVDRRKKTEPKPDPLTAALAAIEDENSELAAMLRQHLKVADGIVSQTPNDDPEQPRARRTPVPGVSGNPRLRQALTAPRPGPTADSWWARRVGAR